MPTPPAHRIVAADRHRVPPPFRSFAVRSDEAEHAWQARAPYGRVHVLATPFLDPATRARLAAIGHARVHTEEFSDIDHAETSWAELAAAGASGIESGIAAALRLTGVLGDDADAYRDGLAGRIHYLGSCGAGFHNDVARHWSRCLFWVLALDVDAVEFVMPHAGLQLALGAGDLLVFDQTMAHGLCRPADRGQALASSFAAAGRRQLFLTGELPLDDARWAALGSPWLAVEEFERRGALDLLVAEFDDRSGAVKRALSLRDGMSRSICHADATSP